MSVCVYSLFVLSCVSSDFATGCFPVQGFLPAVYKIHNLVINSGGVRSESLIYPRRGKTVSSERWQFVEKNIRTIS
jgi:hypothetical protein